MGCEFGQRAEWNHDASRDWHLLKFPEHAGLQRWVADLNALYRGAPAMHEQDAQPAGFEWVDCSDAPQSVVSFLRIGKATDDPVLVVCNFTPVPRPNYRIGVPLGGRWEEALNSDAVHYGGAGWGNYGAVAADAVEQHGRPYSLSLTLPPLSILFFRRNAEDLAEGRREQEEGRAEPEPALEYEAGDLEAAPEA